MSAHWAIKVSVFVKFHIYISTRVLEILRETWKGHFNWLWVSVVVYKDVTQL